ncbi:neprilysin-like [Pseudomyrmex gracilis]|uniref:neprilysin-like n=1 Tax=Pseudomyrmex gracilis TaxID=219809 RepID=UPI000995C6AE|nr:neprilysin-like [Pseudomyrmex gracilis]
MYHFFIDILISIAFAHVTFGAPTKNSNEFSQYTLCVTDECINAASKILANLNRTVDPCDNFYQFVCGKYAHNNQVNDSFPSIESFAEIQKKTKIHLREILEELPKPDDTMSLLKAKLIFAQCVDNENRTDEENIYRIRTEIKKKHPYLWLLDVSSERKKSNVTWQDVSTTLLENGFDNGLFEITVLPDIRMSNSNVIVINGPLLSSSLNYKLKFFNFSFPEWAEYPMIYDIFDIAFIANNLAQENSETDEIRNITQDVLDVATFYVQILSLTDSQEYENEDVNYVSLTIQQWQEEYDKQHPGKNGKIDWYHTIQKAFSSEGIAIQPSEKIVVLAYTYLINLIPVLEQTSSRTIVNYMHFYLNIKLEPYMRRLPHTTQNEIDTRGKTCLDKVNLKSAISHEYVKRYMSHLNIQAIREMIIDITNVVREQLRHSTWMDESTRKASLEKLANMRREVIKPDWYSDEAIDRYYKDLDVGTEYFDNIINILKFEKKKTMSLLRTPVDRSQWSYEPTDSIAYYVMNLNKFVITAALMQNWVNDGLSFLNYGSVGFIVAHEMSHGFDNEGRKYNIDGNAIPWWTQRSINAYENITQCFIDQYDEYLVPGLEHEGIHVNGQWTLNENIADFAGIATAYYAYKNKKAKSDDGPEWRLQGLEEYNNDQVFFMAFGQIFCSNTLPETLKQHIFKVHSVSEIRVRGSLSNFREFSEVYNCPAGKQMNPIKKCSFWSVTWRTRA